jgi:hypothetical protein
LSRRPTDRQHIERLGTVHAVKEDYHKGCKKLYGAVAALSFVADTDLYAERKGFFVLKCGKEMSPADFLSEALQFPEGHGHGAAAQRQGGAAGVDEIA